MSARPQPIAAALDPAPAGRAAVRSSDDGPAAPGGRDDQAGRNGDPLLAALQRFDTPSLANAVEKLEVRNRATGFCSRAMRQLTPELGTLCGYAVTVEAVTMTGEPEASRADAVERYLEVCAAISASPKPAVVVFRETGPFPDYSAHIGEVLATLFQRFGAIGVISDGAVRDLPEIRALRFHAFAPGTVASHANFQIERVQIPVTVCGLTVRPGDLLHGDENGLMTVPGEGRHRLPALVEQIRKAERRVLDYLTGPEVSLDGVRERLVH